MNTWRVGDEHTCPLYANPHTAGWTCAKYAVAHGDRSYAEVEYGLAAPQPEVLEVDLVNHPPHYTSSPACCSGCGKTIECIDITRHMMFAPGNATKYIWRRVFGGKVGEDNVEGLRKAVFYLQDEIKRLGGAL